MKLETSCKFGLVYHALLSYYFYFFNLTILSSLFLPQVGLYSVRVTASPVWWAYSHGRPFDCQMVCYSDHHLNSGH